MTRRDVAKKADPTWPRSRSKRSPRRSRSTSAPTCSTVRARRHGREAPPAPRGGRRRGRTRPGPSAHSRGSSAGASRRPALLALVVFASVLAVIGSTMRLALQRRKTEVEVLRLVGATDRYVKGPFLIEGSAQGALGAIGALVLLGALFLVVRGRLDGELAALSIGVDPTFLPWPVVLGMVGARRTVPRDDHWRRRSGSASWWRCRAVCAGRSRRSRSRRARSRSRRGDSGRPRADGARRTAGLAAQRDRELDDVARPRGARSEDRRRRCGRDERQARHRRARCADRRSARTGDRARAGVLPGHPRRDAPDRRGLRRARRARDARRADAPRDRGRPHGGERPPRPRRRDGARPRAHRARSDLARAVGQRSAMDAEPCRRDRGRGQRRQQAFDRAFETSTGAADYVAVYGGGGGGVVRRTCRPRSASPRRGGGSSSRSQAAPKRAPRDAKGRTVRGSRSGLRSGASSARCTPGAWRSPIGTERTGES